MLRRRPVLRTVGRTAVIAGTATAVAGGVSRRQARRNAPPPGAEEPVETAPAVDPTGQLTKLAGLRDQGILTEEEFSAQKAKILSEM